jgi:hypothetical protein
MGQQQTEERKGYGRNWGKWILIYMVAAAIVYGIVYLIFFTGGGSGGGGGPYG